MEDFFEKIPSFRDPGGLSESSNYHAAPADWWVVLADVRGSTQAIQQGRYKDVNLVGASAIIAVLNALARAPIPYVFGGDGATLLVAPSMLERAKDALRATRKMAREQFDFDLRVGVVPMSELIAAGQQVLVAKHEKSPKLALAMFGGGGLSHAESLLKSAPIPNAYLLDGEPAGTGDFTGLECRWQPIQATRGEMLSVLVRARASDRGTELRIYREIIEEIEAIVGSAAEASPTIALQPKLSFSPGSLRGEQKVRGGSLLRIWALSLLGKFLMTFNLTAFGVQWGNYRKEVTRNSDFWKFDDALRFVIDVSAAQKRALSACLESRALKGEVAFGMHSSREALMTCLVFSYAGNHVHFIDGGDGGYAMAAKQLKAQLKNR